MNYKTFRRYVLVTVIVVLAYLTALTGPLRTDAQARNDIALLRSEVNAPPLPLRFGVKLGENSEAQLKPPPPNPAPAPRWCKTKCASPSPPP